jgi:hypothetical protein
MEPNYSEYSTTELKDALAHIDKESYPERVERIKVELASRQKSEESRLNTVDDDFEPNEQFFTCPTCEKKIGFFSRTANKWGKIKTCPHCNTPFEISVKFKIIAIAFIPALIIQLFILRPLVVGFGLHEAVSTGILCGVLSFISMRYRKVRSTKPLI